jgi:hypothetical protein
MNRLQKNYSSPNRFFLLGFIIFFLNLNIKSQIANYVNNAGFEKVDSVHPFGNVNCATYWQPTDTIKFCYYFYTTSPSFSLPLAPYIPTGFQYPRSGKNLIATQFYCSPATCTTNPNSRGYPRNRLKQVLKPNAIYCVKYYIVNTNNSTVGTDSYGAYMGDQSLDTIVVCTQPLVYLTPQVQWPGNIITDTLIWTAISGTFIATGTEKYIMLGNFRSNTATNTIVLNPNFPLLTHDLYIDDVSLIEMDLPAYAGPDKWIVAGDSAYIGRESDIEIDESCIWHKMTSPTTSVTIDTIAGLWVKPVSTTTYVVRQQLWCSGVKWDTVVVSMSGVGLAEVGNMANNIYLFPNPTQDNLQIKYNGDFRCILNSVYIYNNLGQMIREEEINFKNKTASIKTDDLPNGVYFLQLKNNKSETVCKRFVVAH